MNTDDEPGSWHCDNCGLGFGATIPDTCPECGAPDPSATGDAA